MRISEIAERIPDLPDDEWQDFVTSELGDVDLRYWARVRSRMIYERDNPEKAKKAKKKRRSSSRKSTGMGRKTGPAAVLAKDREASAMAEQVTRVNGSRGPIPLTA